MTIGAVHVRSPRCSAASPKMLAAGRVAARIVLENRPWRADLLGKKLDQSRRRFVFKTAAQIRDI